MCVCPWCGGKADDLGNGLIGCLDCNRITQTYPNRRSRARA